MATLTSLEEGTLHSIRTTRLRICPCMTVATPTSSKERNSHSILTTRLCMCPVIHAIAESPG
eukprot:scaffold24516_cov426-Cylindrotheca_fusiformis.AAC.1